MKLPIAPDDELTVRFKKLKELAESPVAA